MKKYFQIYRNFCQLRKRKVKVIFSKNDLFPFQKNYKQKSSPKKMIPKSSLKKTKL